MAAEKSNAILQRRRRSLGTIGLNQGDTRSPTNLAWSIQVEAMPISDSNQTLSDAKDNRMFLKNNDNNRPRSGDTKNSDPNAQDEMPTNGSHQVITVVATTPDLGKRTSTRQKPRKVNIRKMVFSWRFVIVLLLHFSLVVATTVRNSMPMALVCMVAPSVGDTAIHRNGISPNESIYSVNHTGDIRNGTRGEEDTRLEYEFTWDKEIQGFLLTAISFLSFVGPLLVDFMTRYIGNKWTMTVMSIVTGVLCCVSPASSRFSPYLLLAVRTALGVAVLANLPIIGDTCAWWGPSNEKHIMLSFIFGGINMGGILQSAVSGLLCEIPHDNGWPFVFYFVGAITLLWTLAWHFLSSQKPEEHRFVSAEEKDYIVKHRVGMNVKADVKAEKPPYLTILASSRVLAFVFVGSCDYWMTITFFTNLPFFFVSVLDFTVVETGFLMSVVSALRLFSLGLWTVIVNIMMRKKLRTTLVRKLALCSGYTLGGVGMVIIIFLDQQHKWQIVALLFFVLLNHTVGCCVVPVIPQDMAPKYAGFLTGLAYSMGSFMAISGPLLVSVLTPTGTVDEWRKVWIIFGGMLLLSVVVFALFGDATLQPWAMEGDRDVKVVSPLIALGRRFSALFLSSPFTATNPVQDHEFEFTQEVSPVGQQQLQLNGHPSPADDELSTEKSSSDLKTVTVSHPDGDRGNVSDAFDIDIVEGTSLESTDTEHINGVLDIVHLNADSDVEGSVQELRSEGDVGGSVQDLRSENDVEGSVQELRSQGDLGGRLNEAFDVDEDRRSHTGKENQAMSDVSIVTRM